MASRITLRSPGTKARRTFSSTTSSVCSRVVGSLPSRALEGLEPYSQLSSYLVLCGTHDGDVAGAPISEWDFVNTRKQAVERHLVILRGAWHGGAYDADGTYPHFQCTTDNDYCLDVDSD